MFGGKKEHDHQWQTVSVTYVSPVNRAFTVSGFVDSAMVDQYMRGCTVAAQKCVRTVTASGQECGKLHEERFVGKVDIPGFAWK